MTPWRTVSFVPKVFAALLLLPPIPQATAVEALDLAGWWIAIDRLFPQLYEAGLILPMEELLIVGSDGRVENRLMMFGAPLPELCGDKKLARSDAPLSASARMAVAGDQLTFTESRKPDNLIDDRPEWDFALRLLTVTGTASWTLSREADGRLLVLRPNLLNKSRLVANIPTRTFAKIDPDRLRRLRALPLATDFFSASFSITKHWRCFLANATANDPAFASLRDRPRATPRFLDDAAKAASYFMVLREAASAWVQGEQGVTYRNPADVQVERFLPEHFPDIRMPSSAAEREPLKERSLDLILRLRGEKAGPVVGPY
jgi:hypothetical protein